MAGNFSKWGFHEKEEGQLKVILFISRNKDNIGIENFKERRETFLAMIPADKVFPTSLMQKFLNFVDAGVSGETSRFYISVNARDEKKIRKEILIELIKREEDFSLINIEPLMASVAAKKENALESKWLFDFDILDAFKVEEFIEDIKKIDNEIEVEKHRTPHGYAIITNRGFDTRSLLIKWKDVSLKRDDLLCISWIAKI